MGSAAMQILTHPPCFSSLLKFAYDCRLVGIHHLPYILLNEHTTAAWKSTQSAKFQISKTTMPEIPKQNHLHCGQKMKCNLPVAQHQVMSMKKSSALANNFGETELKEIMGFCQSKTITAGSFE